MLFLSKYFCDTYFSYEILSARISSSVKSSLPIVFTDMLSCVKYAIFGETVVRNDDVFSVSCLLLSAGYFLFFTFSPAFFIE